MVKGSSRTTAWLLWSLAILSGCTGAQDFLKTDRTRWLSPDKPIKAPERSPISPILPNVGLVDQSQEMVPNASFPQEGDWTWVEEEYVLGPTDIVDIFILDLYQEGVEAPMRREISAAGFLDLPLLGDRIKAAGLTLQQLKQEIIRAYSPQILRDPQVTVILAAGRQNVVSILGAVARPGQYTLFRRDMRLLEMLALAGGVVQPDIKYLYVIRPEKAMASRPPAVEAALPPSAEAPTPALPEAAPSEPSARPVTAPPGAAQQDVDRALRELEGALPERREPSPAVVSFAELATGLPTGQDAEVSDASGWRYEAGRWVRSETQPVEAPAAAAAPAEAPQAAGEVPAEPPGQEETVQEPAVKERPPTREEVVQAPPRPPSRRDRGEDPFGWKKADKSNLARIVAINLEELQAGQPRMNIVIRDNDIIQVPYLKSGEFYIGGEVLRPGVYSLTGRQITIKQALAASGNLGPLAWPENSLLVRRVGEYQEQYIPLDIEAIFRDEAPDVYLKADDQIWIGTEVRAMFYAVMRNAFRMTYGFGFIYDRNFSDPLLFTPHGNRFTRL